MILPETLLPHPSSPGSPEPRSWIQLRSYLGLEKGRVSYQPIPPPSNCTWRLSCRGDASQRPVWHELSLNSPPSQSRNLPDVPTCKPTGRALAFSILTYLPSQAALHRLQQTPRPGNSRENACYSISPPQKEEVESSMFRRKK